MNNPTDTSNAPEQSGAPSLGSFEERSASVFGRTTNDAPVAPSDPAGEASSSLQASPAGSEDALAADRAARRAKLDQLKSGERERVDAQARYRAGEQAMARAAAAERERDELKQQIASRVDVSQLDEQGFFDLAAKLQVKPQKLGEWIQKQTNSPHLIAAEAAQKAVDPRITALEQRIAQQDQAMQRMAQERETRETHAAEEAAAHDFASFTEQQAATSPLATKFLQSYGHDEFKALAKGLVAQLPQGAGYQDLLDAIEDQLVPLSKMFSPATAGTPQQSRALSSTNHAAAKAPTTVSNMLAQGRASVVDEERDWASLPYEERSRRAFGF